MQPSTPTEGAASPVTKCDNLSKKSLPLIRWMVLIVALLAEIVAISLVFNHETAFAGGGRSWTALIAVAGWIVRPTIAAIVATLLIGGVGLREELRQQLSGDRGRSSRTWLLLLVQAGTFVVFAWLTDGVQKGRLQSSSHPGVWGITWVTMGLSMLGLWAAAAIPVRLWWPLARRGGAAVLLAGIVVGIAAEEASRLAIKIWESDPGQTLTRATLWSTYSLLHLVCPNPVCRPADWIVGTPSFAVKVYGHCSGAEGMTLILVFVAACLAVFHRRYRFPRALLLLPLGVSLMWVANVLRIVLLVAIGHWGYPSVADKGFHTHAGWLTFNLIGLGVVVSSRRLNYFAAADLPTDSEPAESSNPTAAFLDPLLVIIATTMITGAFTSGFDRFYPLRVLTAAAVLWYFRREYSELKMTWSWTAVAIGVATFVVWMALEPAPTGTAETSPGTGLASLPSGWAAAWLVFRVVGSVVTVPLAEELAFRGYLTRRLIATEFSDVPLGRFTWFSFLISSVLFGALHGRWLAGMLAGMLYAIALYRRGVLADAVLAHATTNALIASYVLTTDSWWLWS
jgi:exosortase E/protease (VPEID-CTERM system)